MTDQSVLISIDPIGARKPVRHAVRRDRGVTLARRKTSSAAVDPDPDYGGLVAAIGALMEQSRRYVARAVNISLHCQIETVHSRAVAPVRRQGRQRHPDFDVLVGRPPDRPAVRARRQGPRRCTDRGLPTGSQRT